MRLALDVIVSHTTRPLLFSAVLGFVLAGVSLLTIVSLLVRYLFFGFGVAGWASTMVSVWFVGGMILGTLGVIGLYLGKVFEQVKGRPLYVVAEVVRDGKALPYRVRQEPVIGRTDDVVGNSTKR